MTLRGSLFSMFCIFMTSFPLQAQGQIHQWSQRFGDASDQRGRGVAVDATGNAIVTGPFQGTVDFGGGLLTSAGGSDICLAKFDPSGNHIWSKRFGDYFEQTGRVVAVDAMGDVIVAGEISGTVDFGGGPLSALGSDTFVAKFDPSGNHLWSELFSVDVAPWGIAVDSDGNVIITGTLDGAVDFGGGVLASAGGTDIFVAKFDPDGTHLWSGSFGGVDNQIGRGVAADGSGNVIIVGAFPGTVDFGGGPLTSAGGSDTFMAKFDADGHHLWSRCFGDMNDQRGWCVAADPGGNIIVASRFWGTVDFGGGPLTSAGEEDIYVAKFDPSGGHLWSQRFGDANGQAAWGLDTDASGNIVVAGSLSGTADFGGGQVDGASFAAKFDPDGVHLWSQAFANESHRGGYVAADAFENVFFTGAFMGTTDFGGGPLTSAGDFDVFLAKFNTSPSVPVVLQAYHSRWAGNYVEISWQLIGSSRARSFEISRAEYPGAPFRRLHEPLVCQRGDEMVFEDRDADPGMTYRYRVIIYEDGEVVASFVTELDTPPDAFALEQNVPNPFNPSTKISFSLDQDAFVTLTIYELSGRHVRKLLQETRDAGSHDVIWRGLDDHGHQVGSGVYLYGLEAGDFMETRRMTFLK